MSKWLLGTVAAVGMVLGLSGLARANIVYLVSSTSAVNCGSAAHGLWTNNVNVSGGTCGNYFDIQAGSTFTVYNDDPDSANWTASLDGFAINPQGSTAEFHLTLASFAETGNYKLENGGAYNPATDTPDVDFFEDISGTIAFGSTVYTVNAADPVPMGLNFQYGPGANAKDPNEFGGSTWLNMLDASSQSVAGHWDFNLTFTAITPTTDVPEPGALAVLGLGLLGLAGLRRRAKAA